MGSRYKIAVFASGSGSNFQNIVNAVVEGNIRGEVSLLVSNKPNSRVVERARQANIDSFVFNPKDYKDRSEYELEIVAELERREIDLIVLAGYMLLVTPVLVERYAGKMINIHPSLLPSFPGLNAIGQAFDYGVKLTGVTVHFVDGGMDTGAIIAQETVVIEDEDTMMSLESKIRSIETTLYPKVVSWFADGRITLDGRKVTIK